MVTNRQSAMSSLRARATIIVLRVAPRRSAVRAWYHWVSALFFRNRRNRQASWIIPRRTRALPALASPRSRRLLPLSSGAPVRPAYRATALRSRSLHEHVGAFNADADHPSQQVDHGMASFSRLAFQSLDACRLDLLDLLLDEAQTIHVAPQLGQRVRRHRSTLRCLQCLQFARP